MIILELADKCFCLTFLHVLRHKKYIKCSIQSSNELSVAAHCYFYLMFKFYVYVDLKYDFHDFKLVSKCKYQLKTCDAISQCKHI